MTSHYDKANPRAEGMARRTVKRAEARKIMDLLDVDLQNGIRMVMAPAPVAFPILILELGEGDVFAVVLFGVHPIRLVFVAIPLVVIIVALIVVFLVRRLELDGGERHRDNQHRTQQGSRQKSLNHTLERSRFMAIDGAKPSISYTSQELSHDQRA
jgi:hypothetical protein